MSRVILLCVVLLAALTHAQERVQTRVCLSSQPSGATVWIDGTNRGLSPLMLFDLGPGVHAVKFRLKGYVEADTLIDMAQGPVIDRSIELEPEKGLLLIKTVPVGCQIKIDGLAAGETPRFIGNLTTKDVHTVRLSKLGYQDQTISVRFNGREPMVREETLIPDAGVISIITEPAGAEVLVNGISRGQSPVVVRDVPKGTATVRFKLDGYKEEVRELRLSAGEEQTLSLTLEGLPGSLHLLSTPVGASFYVNNEARGRGPLSITGLKPGDYVVRCEAEGYAPMTRTLTLGNGRSVREEFRLTNIMGRIEVRTSPIGAEVRVDGRRVGVTKSSGGEYAEFSDAFVIENLPEGEHTVIVRKDGFQEISKTIEVEAKQTAQLGRLVLKRAFVPDVEIITANGVFRGVFKSQTDDTIVIETRPGTDYPIPRQFVRKVEYLINK